MSTTGDTAVRFQAVAPQFTVPDVVRTAEYYRDVLGFQIAGYRADPPVFAIVFRDDVQFFFNRADGAEVRTARRRDGYDAYVGVAGVDALADELRERGADIVEGPCDRCTGSAS